MLPRLLHPVPIYLRQIDRKFTAVQDANLREPIGQVRFQQKPIKLRAQMKIMDTDEPVASEGGVVERSNGYALFLTRELKAAQVEIQRGDRIVQIGDGDDAREVDYYVNELRWRGHYPRHQGPTLLKAYFTDRKPSRQRGDL